MLLFLPAEARANLAYLGDCVAREMAMSRRIKDIETIAARQAHYIQWCTVMKVPDPCGDNPGYEHMAAMYVKHLQFGVNYTNKDGLRAATLSGYASAIGLLFGLRGFDPPIVKDDPNNWGALLIANCKKEEDIAVQRLPLNSAIYAELKRMAQASKSPDSEKNVLFDVTCIGRFLGPRVSEYAQTSPSTIDYHVYPSGKKVIKAFIADDFVFLDKSGKIIDSQSLTDESSDVVKKLRCTWRIQKNRCNGQAITLSSDDKHPQLCPVRAALRLVLRARRCGQPDDRPVACYNVKDKLVYLTGKRVAALFRDAVKTIYPNMSTVERARYSAHSLRVWACVLLDEAGMSPQFIMSRLRWMGNSFRMYLRDTGAIQDKHLDILRAASQEVIDLLDVNTDTLLSEIATGLSIVELDNEMGEYVDDMD
jgi:hypothetical protein